MVWLICGALWLLLLAGPAAAGQESQPEPEQSDQFFSGTVTALAEDRLTVSRSVLGKRSETRTFVITPKTKIEGKLRTKARVTVRYVAGEQGDTAVHIIVRGNQKK